MRRCLPDDDLLPPLQKRGRRRLAGSSYARPLTAILGQSRRRSKPSIWAARTADDDRPLASAMRHERASRLALRSLPLGTKSSCDLTPGPGCRFAREAAVLEPGGTVIGEPRFPGG
jgi:hypothetical protein